MAVAEWREDASGFRYLCTDYRDASDQERYDVAEEGYRAGVLVVVDEGGGIHPAWYKEVKDYNSGIREDDVRVALVGLGRRGPSLAGALNVRARYERTRAFDDEAEALAWLREGV